MVGKKITVWKGREEGEGRGRGETGSGGSRSLVKMEFCQEIERTRKLPARFDRP